MDCDDERLVEHERGVLEAGVDVAVGPLLRRLAHRQAALVGLGELLGGPLDRLRSATPRSAPDRRHRRVPTLPVVRAFGPPGRRLVERIDDERQRLESTSILSTASAAVSSSTAATARIGSPA